MIGSLTLKGSHEAQIQDYGQGTKAWCFFGPDELSQAQIHDSAQRVETQKEVLVDPSQTQIQNFDQGVQTVRMGNTGVKCLVQCEFSHISKYLTWIFTSVINTVSKGLLEKLFVALAFHIRKC